MDSSLAASMNPHVLTTRTSAPAGGASRCPAARSRARERVGVGLVLGAAERLDEEARRPCGDLSGS